MALSFLRPHLLAGSGLASWAHSWVSARPLIYKGPQHQPLTSEFPVSLSLPTFQMGKPRPAQRDLATRPRLQPWTPSLAGFSWPM